MKKLIAIILMAALALSICACSPINKTDVAVLWADGDTAVSPNSLINAMDRALYIENIAYTYYGAGGDEAKQLQQAEEVLNAGCAVLMVEPVNGDAAQSFVDLAKAKNVPIIFFGAGVHADVMASYDKCVDIATAKLRLPYIFDQMVCAYVLGNTEVEKPKDGDMDLDDDGKITYVTIGEIPRDPSGGTTAIAIEKSDDGQPVLNKDGSYKKAVELVALDAAFETLVPVEETIPGGLFGGATTYRHLETADGKTVEMLLVADDVQAQATLVALQAMGLNADALATCFVPVLTVGSQFDYKSHVLAGAPQEAEARKAYLEANKYLVDLTTVAEEDLDKMIYTTTNVIDSGRLSATVIEDHDGIAEAAAAACAALLSGKTAEHVLVDYLVYPE